MSGATPEIYLQRAALYLARPSASRNPGWTTARLARAGFLFDQGLSAREVAIALAAEGMRVSRNAVIGVLTRSGVKLRGAACDPVLRRSARARAPSSCRFSAPSPKPTLTPTPTKAPSLTPSPAPSTSRKVNRGASCQWIEDDPRRDAHKCGATTIAGPEGFIWCEEHRARVYARAPARARRLAEFLLHQWGGA